MQLLYVQTVSFLHFDECRSFERKNKHNSFQTLGLKTDANLLVYIHEYKKQQLQTVLFLLRRNVTVVHLTNPRKQNDTTVSKHAMYEQLSTKKTQNTKSISTSTFLPRNPYYEEVKQCTPLLKIFIKCATKTCDDIKEKVHYLKKHITLNQQNSAQKITQQRTPQVKLTVSYLNFIHVTD